MSNAKSQPGVLGIFTGADFREVEMDPRVLWDGLDRVLWPIARRWRAGSAPF